MEFESFEQALTVCLTAAAGSPEQDEALIYCLEKAPPDLRAMLQKQYDDMQGGKREGASEG